jgi:predicted alpha/beta-fold hydrolase
MAARAREIILDGGNGVRLLGYYSAQADKKPKALVLIIHGWEGSSDSTYVLSTGRSLYRRGCDVIRLNLRDHGPSHHLNEGFFHGALIEETATAVQNAAGLAPYLPFFVVGFSLGGNFGMRIALRRNGAPFGNLRHVICISPVIDPYSSTLAMDRLPLYRYYFLKKWKRSLRRKQQCFPGLYRFDDLLGIDNTLDLTNHIIARYSDFDGHRDYFSRYTLRGDGLEDLAVPVTVVTSRDDPVIPVEDFSSLEGNPYLRISIQRWGGHCGFLDPFPLVSWYEEGIINRIVDS